MAEGPQALHPVKSRLSFSTPSSLVSFSEQSIALALPAGAGACPLGKCGQGGLVARGSGLTVLFLLMFLYWALLAFSVPSWRRYSTRVTHEDFLDCDVQEIRLTELIVPLIS